MFAECKILLSNTSKVQFQAVLFNDQYQKHIRQFLFNSRYFQTAEKSADVWIMTKTLHDRLSEFYSRVIRDSTAWRQWRRVINFRLHIYSKSVFGLYVRIRIWITP